MEFFKKHFHDINFDENRGEVKVLCPFHDDTKPSATVNTEKNLFHCWVCGTGFNEEQFMAKIKGISVGQAVKLLSEFSNHAFAEWEVTYKAELWADEEVREATRALGFTDDYIERMNLGLAMVKDVKTLAIPVFYDGSLMDVRRYNVLKDKSVPKMTSDTGAKAGWVIPYDEWFNSDKRDITYLFEGEKDMLMARFLGLNAITLTGGAGALPNEYVNPAFADRDIVVCYDNDKAGRDGTERVSNHLSKFAKSVKTLDISQVVKEEKEDFYDYISKYDGDIMEFVTLDTVDFETTEVVKEYTTLNSAMGGNKIRKRLHSMVTVTSEFMETYNTPTIIQATKTEEGGENDVMVVGESRYWTLEDNNIHEMLPLIEVDAKDKNLQSVMRQLLNIPFKEKGVDFILKNDQLVYRSVVTDKDSDGNPVALDLYGFDKLTVGGQYDLEYRIYAHPNKNQRVVAIAISSIPLGDNSTFVVDQAKLSLMQTKGTVAERLDYLYQSAKHHVAKHMDYNIWLFSDLVFNSILDFKYGEIMRGALDVFMLGDTQVGKSETTSRLVDLYSFGHFLSLKTSTTVGLIGGSNKVDGSWCNTIGAIPRQHKKLVVLEEFSGARADFIKTMTDIRSSNILRLSRASGELTAPCKLRMITISNPINDENGSPRFLSSFPNGVQPIMELVHGAEDVGRYDAFVLCPKKDGRFNPFDMELIGEPIPKYAYEHKIQWVATRQPENVVFDHGVESYIWQRAEYLNNIFECNVPIFGTTTSKKLARFSVALASLLTNTDTEYQNVVVTKEIVDYMVDFLESNYRSHYFKLDKVKEEWQSYSTYTEAEVAEIEELYPNNSTLFEFLANQSRTTRANLQAISGKDRDEFGLIFNKLVQLRLIRLNMESAYPTEKFRKVYAIMKRLSGELISKHHTRKTYEL